MTGTLEKTAEDRIAELEAEVERLQGEVRLARLAEEYNLEVWQRTGDTKTEKKGDPCRWRYFSNDGEWVYHERMNFWADSGYGQYIPERVAAMAKNAFFSLTNPRLMYDRLGPEARTSTGQPTGQSDYSLLPQFDPQNVIEVIVRIRKP